MNTQVDPESTPLTSSSKRTPINAVSPESATSRTYTTKTKTIVNVDAVTKIRAHAKRAYEAKPFDIIISGHVHIRDDHIFRDGTKRFQSVNLGTWLDAPCYFKIDESGNRLFELSGSDMAQLT